MAHCTFVDSSKHAVVLSLARLTNLRSLNVAHTEFNTNSLSLVAEQLLPIESLDISCTKVRRDFVLSEVISDLIGICLSEHVKKPFPSPR